MGLDDVRGLGQGTDCASTPSKRGEKEKGQVSKNDQNTTSEPMTHSSKQNPQQYLC